eukprot:gnl/TRDRNA2_/TRDRNA2_166709_c2_seq3.p1 gnl/TRDRNA2_/TRDRNA2_166709_c2~~gnl/TRDRNA2_/TRDRNA2_166709_c2_seq3.p1  ORF type:complete len:306 (+),score=46.38 gnl/TRDRNA2_/TRDRNA2_166709_c2_seq3:31-918(+)
MVALALKDGSWDPLSDVPSPSASPPVQTQIGSYTYKLDNLMSRTECDAMILAGEAAGFIRHRSGSRDQVLFSSDQLTKRVAARLQKMVPDMLIGKPNTDKEGQVWVLFGLNLYWSLTKYKPGVDELRPHLDAVKFAGTRCCTAFTLTIYLNDVPQSHGGCTDFSTEVEGRSPAMWVKTLQPTAGSALLLSHEVVHSGKPLLETASPKYILRTDVLYASATNHMAEEALGILMEEGNFELVWPPAESALLRELQHAHAVEDFARSQETPPCTSVGSPESMHADASHVSGNQEIDRR